MTSERENALERIAQRRFVPFSYNHDKYEFNFGDEARSVEELPLSGVLHRSGGELTPHDSEMLLSQAAFASSFNKIHSLPLADTFFKEGWTTELQEETTEVMYEAYSTMHALDATRGAWRPSRSEFALTLYEQHEDPSGHAGVFLQTAGICACIKPEMREDAAFYPLQVMTYSEHNVAHRAERAGLFAGIGHVARRANEYLGMA